MKINLRADKANGWHTTFTVFVNGANAGTLKMSSSEALHFHEIIAAGVDPGSDIFESSGGWSPNPDGATLDRSYVRRGKLSEQ